MTKDDAIASGTYIEDRYEVKKELGSGSFGAVYACYDTHLGNRLIAVKLFPLEISRDPSARARVSEELQCAFRIDHDNVIRFYEPVAHGERVGYAMEYMTGSTLREFMLKTEELPERAVVALLLQISVGARAIHEAGIVHGDLKPENILYSDDGIVKIADFGLANRLRDETPADSSRMIGVSGAVYGTLDYLSPEYFESGYVDERADIYAIGVIGYELLTGKRIFDEPDPRNLVHRKITSIVRIPQEIRDRTSRELCMVIEKALKRNPEERMQSAEELSSALRQMFHRIEPPQEAADAPRLEPPSKWRHLIWPVLLLLVLINLFLLRTQLGSIVDSVKYLFKR